MDRVRRGDLPWMNIDDLHRLILEEILSRFGIHGLTKPRRTSSTASGIVCSPGPMRCAG